MSNLINKYKTALIVIDLQEKLMSKIRFKDMVITNSLLLIEYAKIAGIPIILTEQYPKGLGHTVPAIKEAMPDITPIEKLTFGCFGDKKFTKALKSLKKDTLIVLGIETHVCVCQTVLEALEKYKVYVPVDGVSSQEKGNWVAALERMKEKGAEIVSTEMLLFELMQEAGTDEFKEMLPHIKDKSRKRYGKKKGPIVL